MLPRVQYLSDVRKLIVGVKYNIAAVNCCHVDPLQTTIVDVDNVLFYTVKISILSLILIYHKSFTYNKALTLT